MAAHNNNNKKKGGGVTGAPANWRAPVRMNILQRFKIYNPLQMEYSTVAGRKENVSFGLNRKKQKELQQKEVVKIKKAKRKMTRSIASAMNERVGGISTRGAEKTFEIEQTEMRDLVNLNTAKKSFELDLEEHGPYHIDYTRNGQYLALCGAKGHLSIIRWQDFRLISEEYFSVDADYIHDVKFAMNESMLCCAQREGVYIYNTKCIETHVLRRSMAFPLKLEYLPYHFLLCSVGQHGKLIYLDVSTGSKVTTKNTGLGCCDVMAQNSSNAIVHLGHNNGTVTMWTPSNEQPVARILCHKSRVRGLAINHYGNQMATSDDRGNLKIWDLRTYQPLHEYKSNSMISNLDFSQKGLLAFSTGKTAVIWNLKQNFAPCDGQGEGELAPRHKYLYLQQSLDRRLVTSLKFCPYEDALGIGNSRGFCSIIVPGAGEPNYDLFEADPFETKLKRNHKIVHKLLDKLPPEMIQLNPDFIAMPQKRGVRTQKFVDPDQGKKWARKNLTKNVKNGYRGVIRKRYSKHVHMKDLHIRQEKLIRQLNERKKTHTHEQKDKAQHTKSRIVKALTGKRDEIPSALDRFKGPKRDNRPQRKSVWRRAPKKVQF